MDPTADAFVGHVLRLAGRIDDAMPTLERATRACDLLGSAWPHLRAFHDLGRAYEAKGGHGQGMPRVRRPARPLGRRRAAIHHG